MPVRNGFTLLDQLLAMVLLAFLLGLTMHGAGELRDRLAVRAAADAVRHAFALAREHAGSTGLSTAVRLSEITAAVTVHAGSDSIHHLRLDATHGVGLQTSRDSMAYRPSGLGYGAANMRLILTRGTAVDTVTVSRLGRVK